MSIHSTRERLLASTLIAGAAFTLLSAPVFAQTTATAAPAATAKDKDKDTAPDVVVTGSRIKRNAFTAPDPITVISAEQATLAGYADTASLLQGSSIASGSFQTNDQLTGFVVTGGPGSQTLNIRGLGAQRSIILLDGKRLGPAGVGGTVGPVDLNSIPQWFIQRVEFLKDGASSIYGSDAVAGVVNIITKKNHDGGEITAYVNQPAQTGGAQEQLAADWGKTFDKGYIELSGEYYEQERLGRGQRDYTNCNEDYLFNPTTGARVDFVGAGPNYGHYYKCYNLTNNDIATTAFGTFMYQDPGFTYPTSVQGNNVPTTVSSALGGPLNTIFARQARAGYPLTYPYAHYYTPYTDRASIVSPRQSYNLAGNAGYDFNSTTHLYGSFLFSDRFSKQTAARQLFPTLGSAWIAGNPNNVFAGTGVTPVYPIIALPYDYSQNVKYYRGVIGLKGDITNAGWFNRFSYDVFGVYSRSDATYQVDQIYNDRVVATTTSAAACNTATTNLSGFNCATAPNIPWLSQRIVSGQFTQDERNFLFFKAHSATTYDQYILEAGFTGDLFTLPAGAVGSAFGVSFRHDKINDTPDPQIQASNLWGFSASGHTQGSDEVKEVYGELNIPVLKNYFLVQNLSFDVSGRYSDYQSYGSTSTYKVAGNWTVTPELRFRGSVGTSFRAPALYELYLAHQTGFSGQASVDPCVNYGSSGVNITIQNACAALGIPNNYTGASPNGGGGSATISTGGGKGSLQAETSQAKSLGFVITPKHFGIDRWTNLSVAVDYFDFQVHNEVRTFGAANIITQCLQGQTAFCSLFTRDLNKTSPSYLNILFVNNNYVNVASQGVRGLDATIAANHNFGRWGRLSFETDLTWTFANKTKLLGNSSVTDYNGSTYNYSGPDFTGTAFLNWDYRDWTATWTTQILGKGSDTEIAGGDVFANSRYADLPNGISSATCTAANNYCVYYKQYNNFYAFHTLSVRKKMAQLNADVTVGVRNLFDQPPPKSSTGQFRSGTSDLNAYDMIGRSFFARITKKW